MVVVVDRVVVKKVIHVFSKQFNLGRPSVWLKMDEAKWSCGLGFVLSSLKCNAIVMQSLVSKIALRFLFEFSNQ